MNRRYNDFNTYLRRKFGVRVQKITVDAGFTCPNRDGTLSTGGCIYCNPKGSGTGAHEKGLSITDQLISGKKALSKRYKAKKFIAYFQSFTNTYAPFEQLEKVYKEALEVQDVVGLSIGTRPDCCDESTLDLLETFASEGRLIWIEYGLQSSSDKTLKLINRGHDFNCFEKAVEKTKNRGIKICAHIILGLPGEGRKEILETADVLAKMGIDGVKIHLLYVVRGTELENMYQQKQFKCLSMDQYVQLVCDVLERLPEKMVIQRLTGDPHPHELVAPQWALNKNGTLESIHRTLEGRDSRQGQLSILK